MKVLVTEKALRRAVRQLLREADLGRFSNDTFLRTLKGDSVKVSKEDAMRLLNLIYFTGTNEFTGMEDWQGYESVPATKFTSSGSRTNLGITYEDAVDRLNRGTLTGTDIEKIWQAFMQEVLGLGLTSMQDNQININWEDFAGSIDDYFKKLNYPLNLTSLGVFTYRVLNEPDFANNYVSADNPYAGTIPLESLEPDQLAFLKDTSQAQTFVTSSGPDETAIEGATTEQALKFDVLEALVTGFRIDTKQAAAKQNAIIKSTLSDLAKAVNVAKIATEQSGRSLLKYMTMQTYTPKELESVADALLYPYKHPATIALSAQRLPAATCFAVVDTTNRVLDSDDLSEWTIPMLIAGFGLGFLATAVFPQFRQLAPGRYLSNQSRKLSSLERRIDEARSSFKDLKETDRYKALERLKEEIEDIKAKEIELITTRDAAKTSLKNPRGGTTSGISGTRTAASQLARYDEEIAAIRDEYARLRDLAQKRIDQYEAEVKRLRDAYTASKQDLVQAPSSGVLTTGGAPPARRPPPESEILSNMSSVDRDAYQAHFGPSASIARPDLPVIDLSTATKPGSVASGGMDLRTFRDQVEKSKAILKKYDDSVEALDARAIERTSKQTVMGTLEVPPGFNKDTSKKLSDFVDEAQKEIGSLNSDIKEMRAKIASALEKPIIKGSGVKERCLDWLSKNYTKFLDEGYYAVGITTAVYYAVVDVIVSVIEQNASWLATLTDIERMLLEALQYSVAMTPGADPDNLWTDFVKWWKQPTNHIKDVAAAFADPQGFELTKSLNTDETNRSNYERLAAAIASFAEKASKPDGVTDADYSSLYAARKIFGEPKVPGEVRVDSTQQAPPSAQQNPASGAKP